MSSDRKNLIFDADDTLWENNIYFIEATEAFLDLMEAHELNRDESRRRLTEAEQRFVAERGYGTRGFTASLLHTARELLPDVSDDALSRVEGLGKAILDKDPMEILPGVEEALDHLSQHNRLFVLTKGDDDEQRSKFERSSLGRYFEHIEVVAEKNAATYHRILVDLDLDPHVTWMIGNSPRSDINPALEAGMNAVLIPHPDTWELELEEIQEMESERLTIVESVGDLMMLFTEPGTASVSSG